MAIHITNLYGARGTHATAQQNVARIARGLGFKELGLYSYPVDCDSEEELRKRLDGITSAIEAEDLVIVQSPTWNDISYDKALLDIICCGRKVRVAVFIHDVITMMFDGAPEENYRKLTDIYNMADLVIVPSQAMLDFLRGKGLKVEKILFQSMWDLPFDGEVSIPEFRRQIFFSGSPNRFPAVKAWNYQTPLCWFGGEDFPLNGENIRFKGWRNTAELLAAYGEGGFGLVWEQKSCSDYYKYNQPHKLSTYLAAGIPVIMERGLTHEQTVERYGLGFVVESLGEASDVVKNISEDEYYRLVDHVRDMSFLVREGLFTKKLLIDTVNYLLLI